MPQPRKDKPKAQTGSKTNQMRRSQAEGYGIVALLAVEAVPLSERLKQDSELLRATLQADLYEHFLAFDGATLYVDVNCVGLCLFNATSPALIAARKLVTALAAKGEYEVRCSIATDEPRGADADACDAAILARAMLEIVPLMQVVACDVSEATARRSLPVGYGLKDQGIRYLEAPGRKIRIFQLTHMQLSAEFPEPLDGEEIWDNLPTRVTFFIGREQELDCLAREVYESSLITLVGPGGIGKTSMAIRFGQTCEPSVFIHGVLMIDLSQTETEQQVVQALAATLGVRAHGGKSLEECVYQHIGHKSVLLIFDNCEQATKGIAVVATRLRQKCRQAVILATSRERLYADGEQVIRIEPFATPRENSGESLDQLRDYDAVALFADRARKSQLTFELNESTANSIAAICRLLEGIPLAIELAASQIGPKSPADVLETLREQVFIGLNNSAPDRHSTMEMAIEWSVKLLTKTQRLLLARLSVFSGGWTLEAAYQVCGFGPLKKREDLQEALHSLLEKSMTVSAPQLHQQFTYRFLMPIQAYAARLLDEFNESEIVRERHFAWCLDLAELAYGELTGSDQDLWLEIMHRQSNNLREAFGWAIQHSKNSDPAFKIIRAFYRYWIRRGLQGDPQTYMSRFLATYSDPQDPNVAMVYNLAGILADEQGSLAVARRYLLTSYCLCRRTNEHAIMGLAVSNLSRLQAKFSNDEKSLRYSRKSIAIFRQLEESAENNRRLGVALLGYSGALMCMDRSEEAEKVLLEARKALRNRKDAFLNISLAVTFAELALKRGDSVLSEQILIESLDDQERIQSPERLVDAIILFAVIDLRRGSYLRAARLIGVTASIRTVAAHTLTDRLHNMAELAHQQCKDSIPQYEFNTEYMAGYGMTVCEVIRFIRDTA